MSKFGAISFQKYISKGITHPVVYGDVVYKLRRVKGLKIMKRLRRRQYDLAIIERTIGLVLGPFTALFRSFLKRYTLTNKAIGTIWQALSKTSRRLQGPDPRPLWLLVWTLSAFGPELAYRLRVAQPTLMDVVIYFRYTIILPYMFAYHIFMTLRFALMKKYFTLLQKTLLYYRKLYYRKLYYMKSIFFSTKLEPIKIHFSIRKLIYFLILILMDVIEYE